MNFNGIECGVVRWIHLAQHRSPWRALVNMVLSL
jgi:hypothetical protein